MDMPQYPLEETSLTPEEERQLIAEQARTSAEPTDTQPPIEPRRLTHNQLCYLTECTSKRDRNRKANKAARKARRINRK